MTTQYHQDEFTTLEAMTRATRQREAIESVLATAGRPLTPEEVLIGAKRSVAALGLATVYRNLKRLVADGVLQTVDLPGESPRYEPAEIGHHHHFQCTSCTRVFDVPGCIKGIETFAPRGFAVQHHHVTLYGSCADCGKRRRLPRR